MTCFSLIYEIKCLFEKWVIDKREVILSFLSGRSMQLSQSGFVAQLVERCTGVAEVMGPNPVEAT